MTKKIMMMAVMFAAAVAMADVLVYDYSASFKRIDISRELTNSNNVKFYLDTAKTKSDKFKGYLLMATCTECTATAGVSVDNTADFGDADRGAWSLIYIQRSGANKAYKNHAYRALAKTYVTRFGRGGYSVALMDYVRMDRLDQAAFELSFNIKDNGNPVVEKDGFMGRGAIEAGVGVNNFGYGKLGKNAYELPGTWCMPGATEYCYYLKNASGNVIGDFAYAGCCSQYMFDLCNTDPGIYAPIHGTFSVKLNNSLSFTGKAYKYSKFADAETAVLNKMKVDKLFHDEAETAKFQAYYGETLASAEEW